MNIEIPIMHCFNNSYVIPASVAFYSMLEHSNKEIRYILYVLHTDITIENQNGLHATISKFVNAKIVFINMNNKFSDVFDKLKNKAYFTKEMFYKLIASSIFPQYNKLVISDVDVIYLGNFEEQYIEFDFNDDIYILGFKSPFKKGTWIESYRLHYKEYFNDEEISKLFNGVGAGFLILNLKKIREDEIEDKFIKFLTTNTDRLIQPEQDILNIICSQKIKYLKMNTVVCSYLYEFFIKKEDFLNIDNYTEQELRFILENPIQLHYAGKIKPWFSPGCIKSEYWYYYLLKTTFFYKHMNNLENLINQQDDFSSIKLKTKIKLTLKHFLKYFLTKMISISI